MQEKENKKEKGRKEKLKKKKKNQVKYNVLSLFVTSKPFDLFQFIHIKII